MSAKYIYHPGTGTLISANECLIFDMDEYLEAARDGQPLTDELTEFLIEELETSSEAAEAVREVGQKII